MSSTTVELPLEHFPGELPTAIRRARSVFIKSTSQVDVITTEPTKCPTCGTMRAFFTLKRPDPRGPWLVCCWQCDIDGKPTA